jgi:hypothetical protein
MESIAELSFFKLSFDDKGGLEDRQQIAELIDHISTATPARLAVVSHGWRNDEDYATTLYSELFTNVAQRLKARGVPRASMPTVVGIYWPSMALPEFGSVTAKPDADGVAAAVMPAPGIDPDTIKVQLESLIKAFGGGPQLQQAKALLNHLGDRPGDQITFVNL